MDDIDELEIWEYLASELNELKQHTDILGDALDDWDLQEDLLTNDR